MIRALRDLGGALEDEAGSLEGLVSFDCLRSGIIMRGVGETRRETADRKLVEQFMGITSNSPPRNSEW